MSKKLYVGNLPFSFDDEKLMEVFSAYGEITEAKLIRDKFSGKSKGFGFVTFANDENGTKAIEELNEKEVEGRNLRVSEAKPMEERTDGDRPPRRFGGNGGGGRSFGNRDSRPPRRY